MPRASPVYDTDAQATSPAPPGIAAPIDRQRLCVGIATRDDPTGAWTMVQALRLYQPEVADRLTILLIDQHPEGPGAARLRELAATIPALRYLPVTGARDTALAVLAREADAEIICLLYARVLPRPGTLEALLAWFDRHPACDALIETVPGDEEGTTAFRPVPDLRAFGAHLTDLSDRHPQDYTATSALVACRRAAWPLIAPALGIVPGSGAAIPWQQIADQSRNPFDFFPGIFCLNLDSAIGRWRQAAHHYRRLGIADRVERFSALPTPENHHRGCALSWRAMIAEAARRGYEQILVFEDDALFLDTTLAVLRDALPTIAAREWDLFYLGAVVWSQEFPYVTGSTALQECGPVTCTHALAVHRRAYARILADVPGNGEDFDRWLAEWFAIDQYFSRKIADGAFRAFITAPRVATQPALLNYDNADKALADRYVRFDPD